MHSRGYMNVNGVIETVVGSSECLGDYFFDDLLDYARSNGVSGLALCLDERYRFVLLFAGGEPEGAVFSDERGILYGDKAAFMGNEMGVDDEKRQFRFYAQDPGVISDLTSRCRLYDKTCLKKGFRMSVPEIGGKKAHGPGVVCITVLENSAPRRGMRVSIRKDRHLVGSDSTMGDGRVCFKLLAGTYEYIIFDGARECGRGVFDLHDRHADLVVEITGRGAGAQVMR